MLPDDRTPIGYFRGEPGLENIAVRIGGNYGAAPSAVADEWKRFETKLRLIGADKHPRVIPRSCDSFHFHYPSSLAGRLILAQDVSPSEAKQFWMGSSAVQSNP
jgi:hypothetical protein